MNWRYYFTNTIADRDYKYNHRGLVQNVEEEGEKYAAEVIGTVPYEVSVQKKANHQLGMSCICLYAKDGTKCKNMAALCAHLGTALKENELVLVAPEKFWKVDVEIHLFPFKNVPGEKKYTYFDLGVIARGVSIMSSQLEAARKLVEQGDNELKNVNVGHYIKIEDLIKILTGEYDVE